jgi:hypothetical protein
VDVLKPLPTSPTVLARAIAEHDQRPAIATTLSPSGSSLQQRAAHVVTGEAAQWAAILSVPVFMLVLCLARLSAGGFEMIDVDSLRPLLLVQVHRCRT